MKLEEILPALREGKAATNKDYDDAGEYWTLGYIGLGEIYDDHGNLIQGNKTLTMHRFDIMGKVDRSKNSWGIPRWAVLSDKWELL